MKHSVPLTAAGVALSLLLLASCGTAAPTASQAPAKDAVSADTTTTSTPEDAPKDAAPQVTNGQDSITVKGSGKGETTPTAFDQPYYLVRTTNAAAAEYGTVQVSIKGQELPAIMSMSAEYTTVFQPKSASVVFTIEATGDYTLQFTKARAHLAITLCRCLNIPARYVTGYLGDIGIEAEPDPMDFSAWFEVYLGGAWRTFDALHNTPRIGRVPIVRGRDAADVPISMVFGPSTLNRFDVLTAEIAG